MLNITCMRSDDNSQESYLFPLGWSWRVQAVSLCGKCLYSLSQLIKKKSSITSVDKTRLPTSLLASILIRPLLCACTKINHMTQIFKEFSYNMQIKSYFLANMY